LLTLMPLMMPPPPFRAAAFDAVLHYDDAVV
jgi:hypothetical protein